MRVQDFLKAIVKQPVRTAEITYAVPAGWSSVEQIRDELNLAYTRNASSRALDLFRRGVLDRQPHQFKSGTGQCHKAFIYRPRPPFKTIKAASQGVFEAQAEAVPAGWVRIVDYAMRFKVSDVAIRSRVARSGIKPRFFKTARGSSGLHKNAYYRKADLDRIYR